MTIEPVLSLIDLRTAGLALVLLLGGAVLLTRPMLLRLKSRREATAPPRPPSIAERVAMLHTAAKERDELSKLVDEARELIRLGCAQLDARLERVERASAMMEPPRAAAPPPSIGDLHVRAARPVSAAGEPVADPMTRQVYSLADEGLTPVEIASRLQEHAGKVELLLALRRV